MPKRIKALFCVETVALLAAAAWILVLLFSAELPASPYLSVNVNPVQPGIWSNHGFSLLQFRRRYLCIRELP